MIKCRLLQGTVVVFVSQQHVNRFVQKPNFGSIVVSTTSSSPSSVLFLQAVDEMNGKEINGKVIYVGRAQKRLERQGELKRKFDQIKQDRVQRYQVLPVHIQSPCDWVKLITSDCRPASPPSGCESVREEPG